MSYLPNHLDHDLAVHLCEAAALDETERATCAIVALAARAGEAISIERHAAFVMVLRKTSAS